MEREKKVLARGLEAPLETLEDIACLEADMREFSRALNRRKLEIATRVFRLANIPLDQAAEIARAACIVAREYQKHNIPVADEKRVLKHAKQS